MANVFSNFWNWLTGANTNEDERIEINVDDVQRASRAQEEQRLSEGAQIAPEEAPQREPKNIKFALRSPEDNNQLGIDRNKETGESYLVGGTAMERFWFRVKRRFNQFTSIFSKHLFWNKKTAARAAEEYEDIKPENIDNDEKEMEEEKEELYDMVMDNKYAGHELSEASQKLLRGEELSEEELEAVREEAESYMNKKKENEENDELDESEELGDGMRERTSYDQEMQEEGMADIKPLGKNNVNKENDKNKSFSL